MRPSRKRPKPNPPVDQLSTSDQAGENLPMPAKKISTASNGNPSSVSTANIGTQNEQNENKPTPVKLAKESSNKKLQSESSWYGTWPRKSTASTQVARETILADKPPKTPNNASSSSDLSRFEPKESKKPQPSPLSGKPPSMDPGKSKETLDVTMGGTLEDGRSEDAETKTDNALSTNKPTKPSENMPAPARPAKESTAGDDSSQRPATASGWLGGWLSRQPPQRKDAKEDVSQASKVPEMAENSPQHTDRSNDVNERQDQATGVAPHDGRDDLQPPSSTTASWFGFWPTIGSTTTAQTPAVAQVPVKLNKDKDTVMEEAPESTAQTSTQPAAGSSWAFWSSDSSKKTTNTDGATSKSGELAVSGEASQDSPEPAKIAPVVEPKELKKGKSSKRGRPQSLEVDEESKKLVQPRPAKETPSQSPAPTKTSPPNLLIPSVRQTYRLVENPSILQQLARLLLHTHQPPARHLFLTKDTPKIKKALAIGVHGLFPAPLLRTVIGQPTGTSIKFASHAAAAIRRWAETHGSADVEIQNVALESDGKIGDRVDNLWKLLLNWIDQVRKSDFILVACHSQGVPVAVMLVAKLIEFGVVSSGKIGVCAMAGVSLGPFPDYKSRLLSGSAGELFEFADPESTISKRYEDALRVALKYGVRISYCGSIDDQLVSMESSTFSIASHPYIFRSVFVDGRIHAPDFLSHLVGFALKLRNLGVSDHGLIRELSAPLAGSLYTGEGHSRLYDDTQVYDLAVEFALETTATPSPIPLSLQKYEIPNSANANPYLLPWIMRGLLEEDFVKTELGTETSELLKQFDDWKPATKVLKDVKYRLEAVRSKL